MKVWHLIPHLKMGGAESLVANYALNIDKKKVDLTIVTLSKRNNTLFEKVILENGIKIIFLDDMIKKQGKARIFSNIYAFIKKRLLFLKLVKEHRPDIIHGHLTVNGYLILLKNRKMNIKLFYTFHSDVKKMYNKRLKQKLFTYFCIRFKGMIPIALHSEMQQEVNNLFHTNRCIIIKNGINLSRFNPINYDKNAIRKSLKIDPSSFVIGHIGRFVEVKNHKFVIKIFIMVKNKIPNSKLVLIGTGKLVNEIKKILKESNLEDSVLLLGNRADIPELLSVMDVFLFPSLYEGFPMVLIEAQAMGIKCVISDTITKDVINTNLVVSKSLKDPIDEWCDLIINHPFKGKLEGNLEKFDTNYVMKDLLKHYISS